MLGTLVCLSLIAPSTYRNVEIVGGGFVTGVIPHPRQKDLVYARTDIGGAYRWDVRTSRWVPIMDWITRPDWNLYGVESLAVAPSDPKRVWVAAGTYTNEWSKIPGAILASRDQGRNWKRYNLPFKNGGNEEGRSMGERLSVDPANPDVLFFATRHNGLLASTDGGATWSPAGNFPIKGRTNRIGVVWTLFVPRGEKAGSRTSTVYAGVAVPGTEAIWRSLDAGKIWRPVQGQPKGMMPHQAKLAANGQMIVVYCDQPGPNGVGDGFVWRFDTKKGGWSDVTPERPGPGNTFGYGGVAIDAYAPNTFMVSTLCRWSKHDTVFRTTDGGKNWRSLKDVSKMDASKSPFLKWGRAEADFGHWIGDVEIDPFRPERGWFVTGATIWGTDDLKKSDKGFPLTWQVKAEGLEETAVLDLISPPEGPRLVSGLGDIGGFVHTDFTRSPASGMLQNPQMSNFDDLDYAGQAPNVVVRVGRGGGAPILGGVSRDSAKTWKVLGSNPPGGKGSGSVAIAADGSVLIWAPAGSSAYWTLDDGETWSECKGLPKGIRIVSDKADPKRFLGYVRESGDVFVSTDRGTTFVKAATGMSSENGRPVFVFDRAQDVWLPTGNALFRSKDGGTKWSKVSGIAAEYLGFGKAMPGSSYPAIYVNGTLKGKPGLFRSTDEGKSWKQINDSKSGFGTMNVVTGDPRQFGRCYVGTNGRGIVIFESN